MRTAEAVRICFDCTGADCSSWIKESGFRETRVEHLVGPDSIVIGTK